MGGIVSTPELLGRQQRRLRLDAVLEAPRRSVAGAHMDSTRPLSKSDLRGPQIHCWTLGARVEFTTVEVGEAEL